MSAADNAAYFEHLNSPPRSIEDALTRDYPPARPVPCAECPWRRDATPGWLGPYNAAKWLEIAHSESPIACHMSLVGDGGWAEGVEQCAGAAAFREHVCKLPHNPTIATGPERADVFATSAEFADHHDRDQ